MSQVAECARLHRSAAGHCSSLQGHVMDASLVAHAGTLRAIGSSCPVYKKCPLKEKGDVD